MLVVSRRKDEKLRLILDQEVVDITIIRIDSNKVRIGVDAGSKVVILRHELLSNENGQL